MYLAYLVFIKCHSCFDSIYKNYPLYNIPLIGISLEVDQENCIYQFYQK